MKKEVMEFKLVEKTENQRFYAMSKPIHEVCRLDYDYKEDMQWVRERSKPDIRDVIPEKLEDVEYICISDAHTHIERLVFLGIKLAGGRYVRLSAGHIDGRMTFLIDGGNSRAVHPDEVYLRRLASKNGYEYKLFDH